MECKVDALLLRAADYGENDKIVTLLTADRGKIGAALKGVKKAGAKLKFAAQPFCFAEYVLAERAGRYTVTSCSLHDGFYSLREDVGTFYAASCVAETCDGLMYEGIVNGEMLVIALRALEEMCGGAAGPALVRFLLSAVSLAGYPVSLGACPVCGKELSGRLAFDMASGSFSCRGCTDGAPASESTLFALRAAEAGGQGDADGVRRALRLLGAYYAYQTERELKSLREYLALE